MRALTLVLLIVALAGCAGTRTADPNYTQLVRFYEAEREATNQRFSTIAGTAEGCEDDACRTTIAAFAALAQVSGGGSAGAPPAFRKTYHPAWNILGATVPALINGAVAWQQSENNRDVTLGQYDWLGGMMRDLSQSPALRAPTITVGGDYVPGSQHIGDAVGRDLISGHVGDTIGGDQHIGDDIRRDTIGGDRIDNAGNIGTDNRIDSPGPYDIGDECEGELCQGETNPPPEPEPPDDTDG